MNRIRSPRRILPFPVIALLFAACSDTSPTAPSMPGEDPAVSISREAPLIVCPTDASRSVSRTIGIFGGSLELDGHRVTIPIGAVLLPTEFTLTVPESDHVEIDVTAEGRESYHFLLPVSLTISYERCAESDLADEDLHIYYIRGHGDGLLDLLGGGLLPLVDMGGTNDAASRSVTTTTTHLSGYAVGEG